MDNDVAENVAHNAVRTHGMVLVSAQPDVPYFHWQVRVYLHQFATQYDLRAHSYAIFAYAGDSPSPVLRKLREDGFNVVWYRDTRTAQERAYIPSVRPHLLCKFFHQFPHLGACAFIHDSDVLFTRLPRFDKLLDDDVNYLSDTIGYIGARYIIDCGRRYSAKHGVDERHLLQTMCASVSIDAEQVERNEMRSGGAQYLLKGTTSEFWREALRDTLALHVCLQQYEAEHPISQGIQSWCAGMWAELWLLWKRGHDVEVHPALAFAWATESYSRLQSPQISIFHLAGITENLKTSVFWKAQYRQRDILQLPDATFDYVSKNSSTWYYVQWVRAARHYFNRSLPRVNPGSLVLTCEVETPNGPEIDRLMPKRSRRYLLSSDSEHRYTLVPNNDQNNYDMRWTLLPADECRVFLEFRFTRRLLACDWNGNVVHSENRVQPDGWEGWTIVCSPAPSDLIYFTLRSNYGFYLSFDVSDGDMALRIIATRAAEKALRFRIRF